MDQSRAIGRAEGMLGKIVPVVRLVHPFPVTVVVLTTILLVVVAHRGNPGALVLLRAGAVILLSQAAVGALNDYVDRFVDARTQPEKPIPSGLVAPPLALSIVCISSALLIPVALSFGPISLLLAGVGTAAGITYDLWLKPTPFSFAGYLVGFLTLLTWVWEIAGRFSVWFALVYPVGCLLLVAAHLAQSLPDIEADRRVGNLGLAVLLGPIWSFRAVLVLYAAVTLGGLALAVATRSYGALTLIVAAALLAIGAWLRSRRSFDRSARQVIFRLLAPGLALLGIGGLLALTVLGS
jgi:4-hydroxybenzoate polyprenyltransferase